MLLARDRFGSTVRIRALGLVSETSGVSLAGPEADSWGFRRRYIYIISESCSRSTRNAVRNHPGVEFTVYRIHPIEALCSAK